MRAHHPKCDGIRKNWSMMAKCITLLTQKAWKHVDRKCDWFAKDARNIRLGLASDDFNPFGMQNVTYTTWPVILIPYNLPPWLLKAM